MITAAEARELAKLSDVDIERHLDNIGKTIESFASNGKRSLILSNTTPYDPEYMVKEPDAYSGVELTPLQKRLQEKLKYFGYGMGIVGEKYDRNKTRAGNPDDGVDMQTNYWITISW